jgi:hypothetical protein
MVLKWLTVEQLFVFCARNEVLKCHRLQLYVSVSTTEGVLKTCDTRDKRVILCFILLPISLHEVAPVPS